MRIALLIFLATFATTASAQRIYQWVDENGVTQFSDTPPPDASEEPIYKWIDENGVMQFSDNPPPEYIESEMLVLGFPQTAERDAETNKAIIQERVQQIEAMIEEIHEARRARKTEALQQTVSILEALPDIGSSAGGSLEALTNLQDGVAWPPTGGIATQRRTDTEAAAELAEIAVEALPQAGPGSSQELSTAATQVPRSVEDVLAPKIEKIYRRPRNRGVGAKHWWGSQR